MVVEVNDEDGFSVPRPRRRWVEANPLPNMLTEQRDSACRPLRHPFVCCGNTNTESLEAKS